MTDYQRACEVVGCEAVIGPYFVEAAEEWLMGLYAVTLYRLSASGHYVVDLGHDQFEADTLTAALTAAVLAVAGENDG